MQTPDNLWTLNVFPLCGHLSISSGSLPWITPQAAILSPMHVSPGILYFSDFIGYENCVSLVWDQECCIFLKIYQKW